MEVLIPGRLEVAGGGKIWLAVERLCGLHHAAERRGAAASVSSGVGLR